MNYSYIFTRMFNKGFIGFGFGLFLFLLLLGFCLIFYFLFIKNKYLNKMCGCNKKDSVREGFKSDSGTETGTGTGTSGWSDDLLNRFASYQDTANDNRNRYNMGIIQQQASPYEAETLIHTGYWPWSDDTKYEYTDAIWHHKIIKINVGNALDYAMKTYNESAIKQMMSWNTKEGQFLLYGSKGKGDKYDTIKCSTDESNNASMIGIIKKEFKDDYIENSVPISNEDIPLKMPGFSFLNGPCNPCVALHNDYSCPFKLNVKGDDTTSPIWSRLWS